MGWGTRTDRCTRETTPHCLSVLFWKGAAWRTPEKGAGGGAGIELSLGVLLFLTLGTMELDLDPVCVWGGGGREQGVSALLLECEAGGQGSQSLRLLRVSSLLGSGEDVEESGGPGNYLLHPRGL